MKRSNKALLLDIRQAIEYIKEDTQGYDLGKFKANRTVRDAVYRNFSIIGEAIKRIEDQIKDKQPQTPWKKIAASAMCSSTIILASISSLYGA